MKTGLRNLDNILDDDNISRSKSTLFWFHWLIICGSFFITIIAWQLSLKQVSTKAEFEFNKQADRLVSLIAERMNKYEDALWSGVAAIHAHNDDINMEEWAKFSNVLNLPERYPGINGIGVIYKVDRDSADHFIEERVGNAEGFSIFPDHDRDILLPITYIEPILLNQAAWGLDVAHEKNRYESALKARDAGNAMITGPITLVQDAEKTPGFLFYAPFYKKPYLDNVAERRDNFLGLVYAPFIMKNLMEGTLRQEKRSVSLRISDGDAILYDENVNANPTYDPEALHKKRLIVKQHGRDWTLDIQNTKSFLKETSSSLPRVILAAGLVIDTLLLLLFFSLTRSHRKIFNYSYNIKERLVDSIEFQNLVLDVIPNFIFIKDDNFKIVECNTAFFSLYPEAQRNHVIGYTTVEAYDETEAKEFLKNDQYALDHGSHEAVESIRFPNGETRIFNTKKIRFLSEGCTYILGISTDITDLKKAEAVILKSNKELEHFAYVTSHDLQEPLRMISNFTSLLENEYKDIFDETAKTYMGFIMDHAGRMRQLIADLLDYSRMGEGEEKYEIIDPDKYILTVKNNLSILIKETGAVFTQDDMTKIRAVPVNFISLIQNLISNAIKYQDKSRSPRIHIGFQDEKDHWAFSISDNGIGIKEEYLEQIFVMFKRLESKSEYSGTGIGLAICYKIVDSMEGKIFAESVFGEGTTVHFTIPKTKDYNIGS